MNTKAATCTADGYKTYKCRVCNTTKQEKSQNKLGHLYNRSAATCTEMRYCIRSGCGHVYQYALGHDYSILLRFDPPHGSTNGTAVFQCSRCSSTRTDVIKPGSNALSQRLFSKSELMVSESGYRALYFVGSDVPALFKEISWYIDEIEKNPGFDDNNRADYGNHPLLKAMQRETQIDGNLTVKGLIVNLFKPVRDKNRAQGLADWGWYEYDVSVIYMGFPRNIGSEFDYDEYVGTQYCYIPAGKCTFTPIR
ncbi:MAG: hypothetical protein J5845_04595 [Lachnospiraceae bacterium]|nr:hypothetical protein [Lachnospiraceae bacterium]